VISITPAFFGSGIELKTYKVSGSTPTKIYQSINANGPYSKWLKQRATGETEADPAYRFHLEAIYGTCRIVVDKVPAVVLRLSVVLPKWMPRSWGLPARPSGPRAPAADAPGAFPPIIMVAAREDFAPR
jgi:hypothetical protein